MCVYTRQYASERAPLCNLAGMDLKQMALILLLGLWGTRSS